MIFRFCKNRKHKELNRDRETVRRITVQPSRKPPKTSFAQESSKTISPPPAYSTAIKTIFNTQNAITEEKNAETFRTYNGRNYKVVKVRKTEKFENSFAYFLNSLERQRNATDSNGKNAIGSSFQLSTGLQQLHEINCKQLTETYQGKLLLS